MTDDIAARAVTEIFKFALYGRRTVKLLAFTSKSRKGPLFIRRVLKINPLNPELNPICYLLALLEAHHFLHVSRIRVKLLTFKRLMSYIYIYIWSTHS